MEPGAAGHVDVQVRVMEPVKPPEEADLVKEEVLEVNRQVQNDDTDNAGRKGLEVELVQGPQPRDSALRASPTPGSKSTNRPTRELTTVRKGWSPSGRTSPFEVCGAGRASPKSP